MNVTRAWGALGAIAFGAACIDANWTSPASAGAPEKQSSLLVSKLNFIVPNADIPLPVRVETPSVPWEHLVVEVRADFPPGFSISEGHVGRGNTWWIPADKLSKATWRVAASMDKPIEIELSLLAAHPVALKGANARSAATTGRGRGDLDALILLAERLLSEGNVAHARRFLERAADGGSSKAAARLAATFQADLLMQVNARGMRPDSRQAEHWRHRARLLQDLERAANSSVTVLMEARTVLMSAPEDLLPGQDRIVSAGPPRQPERTLQPSSIVQVAKIDSTLDGMRLVKRGDQLFSTGQVTQARRYYQRAAEAGLAEAALRLERTFQQSVTAGAGAKEVQPKQTEARRRYGRARDTGTTILPGERFLQLESR